MLDVHFSGLKIAFTVVSYSINEMHIEKYVIRKIIRSYMYLKF